jgi:ribose 5-phosphate isomerase B
MIALGSDHAGFDKKQVVKKYLDDHHLAYHDFGTFDKASVDYPDYAALVGEAVSKGEMPEGILLCSSAVGVSIVANKFHHVRAALVFRKEIASLARQHNNANVICLPANFMSDDDIVQCLESWFAAKFEGGRHERRVEKIDRVESQQR